MRAVRVHACDRRADDVADGELRAPCCLCLRAGPPGCRRSRPTGVMTITRSSGRRSDRGSGTPSRSRPRPGCARAARSGTCRPGRRATRCRRRRSDHARQAGQRRRSSLISVRSTSPCSMRQRPTQRVLDRARLLEDLLEHEVLVAGLLRHHRVPRDALRLPRHRLRRCVEEASRRRRAARPSRPSSRNTTSRVWARMAGMSEATKVLAVAEADDKRAALVTHGDDRPRVSRSRRRPARRPAQPTQGSRAHRGVAARRPAAPRRRGAPPLSVSVSVRKTMPRPAARRFSSR